MRAGEVEERTRAWCSRETGERFVCRTAGHVSGDMGMRTRFERGCRVTTATLSLIARLVRRNRSRRRGTGTRPAATIRSARLVRPHEDPIRDPVYAELVVPGQSWPELPEDVPGVVSRP